jgi:hypothetical protein
MEDREDVSLPIIPPPRQSPPPPPPQMEDFIQGQRVFGFIQ